MSVRIRTAEGDSSVNIGAVTGKLDAFTCQEIFDSLNARLSGTAPNLVLDLSELDLLASSGIGIILKLQGKSQALGGEVVICSPNTIVEKVLNVMNMSQVLKIFEAEHEALGHFGIKVEVPDEPDLDADLEADLDLPEEDSESSSA